jgi:hypothetical protein
MKLFLLLALVICSGISNAGPVEQVTFVAQPQIEIENGQIVGCGWRLMSIPNVTDRKTKSYAVDVSFYLVNIEFALVKGGILEVDAKTLQTNKFPTALNAKSFWIKSQTANATSPLDGVYKKTNAPINYLLYATEFDPVTPLFNSVVQDNKIWVGFKLVNEDMERIFSGNVRVTSADAGDMSKCLSDFQARVKKIYNR